MNRIDWSELKRIFAEACELGPEERSALLDQRCAGKPGLRANLDEYLRYHQELASRRAHTGATPSGEVPGARIGRYRLVERIGEGGFGTVWMAEQEEPLKRLVALKLLKPGMDSKAVLARFDVERQALALMEHPGIAHILDGGATEEGRPYFVMELVRGLPITRYCDEHGSSTAERLALFREVCLAVQHAHYKGVIHRDLKPSNVLVSEQDGKPQPKVIDFGVAKATELQMTEKTLATGLDQLIGTPDYMAPEQAAPGATDIDTRADVYALGVLLYELLTGTKPFEMRALFVHGLEQVLRTIREVEPERPSLRLATLGERRADVALQRGTTPERLQAALATDLDWLVMRALEKDRAQRYPTAQDFADDVTHYLRHEPLSAGPPSAIYKLRKFVRRNRISVAAAAAVGLALVVGSAIAWRGFYVAEERRVLAEQKTREADQQRELAEQRGAEAVEQRAEALRHAESERAQREIAVAKEGEALHELARSEFFVQLLFDMLGSADPHSARHADWKVSEMLEQFENELAPRLAGEPEVGGAAYLVLAHAWLGIGDHQRAKASLERAQPQLAAHPRADTTLANLELQAQYLHALQDWPGALEFQRQALEQREALGQPEGQFEVVSGRIYLSDLLRHTGAPTEAEELLRKVLAGLETREPRDPELEFQAVSGLAAILAVERPEEAEQLLRSAMESLPEDSLGRPRRAATLASIVASQGRFAEAEELLRAAEPQLRLRLGEQHPELGPLLNSLGNAQLRQGKTADSELSYRKALEVARVHSPPGSSQLVRSLSGLATARIFQGKAEEALPQLHEALEIRRASPSDEDPDLASCVSNLAGALLSLSRFEEALPYSVEEVDLYRAQLPASREALDRGLLVNAEILRELKLLDESEAATRERMALYPVPGEDPPAMRGQALVGLGETLIAQQRWSEAETCLRDALQLLEPLVKPGHWALETARSLLGAALVGEGRSSEGETLLRSAARRIQPQVMRKPKKRAALERLLQYLEASGQVDDAAACRAELDKLP